MAKNNKFHVFDTLTKEEQLELINKSILEFEDRITIYRQELKKAKDFKKEIESIPLNSVIIKGHYIGQPKDNSGYAKMITRIIIPEREIKLK